MKQNLEQVKCHMTRWHNGDTFVNIPTCSNDKLQVYYDVCCEIGYILEANRIQSEAIKRNFNLQDNYDILKKIPPLTSREITLYIIQHISKDHLRGEDLYISEINDITYFSWNECEFSEITKLYNAAIDNWENMITLIDCNCKQHISIDFNKYPALAIDAINKNLFK